MRVRACVCVYVCVCVCVCVCTGMPGNNCPVLRSVLGAVSRSQSLCHACFHALGYLCCICAALSDVARAGLVLRGRLLAGAVVGKVWRERLAHPVRSRPARVLLVFLLCSCLAAAA